MQPRVSRSSWQWLCLEDQPGVAAIPKRFLKLGRGRAGRQRAHLHPLRRSPATPRLGNRFETHLNTQPQGSSVITSVSTVAPSGIIPNPPAPFPTNFTSSFPDHMVGTVVVSASQIPTARIDARV